jgi:ribA/ribD-fused uncharacterized protein
VVATLQEIDTVRKHFKPVVTYAGTEDDNWPTHCNKRPNEQVDFFDATEYDWLSNFSHCRVRIPHGEDGSWIHCQTVEAAFQAMKTTDANLRIYIAGCNPGTAKFVGKNRKRTVLREDWEQIKVKVMHDLLRQKFQDATLRDRLLATGEAVLIEGNTWHDREWGQAPLGKGRNLLGQLLMLVREELKG